MRLGNVMDPVAQRLLELQKVSSTQWLLRVVGAAATVLALQLALGEGGLFAHFGTVLVTSAVAVAALVQFLRPDSDVGILAPAAILLSLIGQGDLTMLRAAGVGLALLIAHAASALAATIPVHGEFDRSAWRLGARDLLGVLAISALGGLLVIALAGVQFGPWMMVLGVLAVVALFATVLPRPE